MGLTKRMVAKCIKNHSKELEDGAKMVMRAQKLEELGKYEQAIKRYEKAEKMFKSAYDIAVLIKDKAYQAEAKVLMQQVDIQKRNAIVTDFYRGGIDN